MAWLCIFALLPNLLLLAVSLLQRGTVAPVEPVFTLANYLRLFDASILRIVLDSLGMAGMAMILCLHRRLSVCLYHRQVQSRHPPFLLLLVMIPFWTNSLIRTYALVPSSRPTASQQPAALARA